MHMKLLLSSIIFLSFSVFADSNCAKLENFVGLYKLVETSCSGPFGPELEVQPLENCFLITSDGIGVCPTMEADSSDKCYSDQNKLYVKTCVEKANCKPQSWAYEFTQEEVLFSAKGCKARYLRSR